MDCGELINSNDTNLVINSDGTLLDDIITFSCTTGFVVNGSNSLTCQEDATWSGTLPSCIPGKCNFIQGLVCI